MSDVVSVIPTKILVPIDFSPSSHTALEAATELAEKFHAHLHLLHVIPEFPVVSSKRRRKLPKSILKFRLLDWRPRK
jgi:nucleotide-binding universal stress UspA family protein